MHQLQTSTYSLAEWLEDFFELYTRHAERGIPNIQRVYADFQDVWLRETTHFLITNKESWELTDDDVEYLEDRLEKFGFVCPTFDQMVLVANTARLIYETFNRQIINSGVRDLW